jgi:subtilisin family serine protease
VTPNDTHFDDYQQWDMFQVQSVPNVYGTYAWGYTTGAPRIAIAVIDTGADANHQDLSGGKVTYGEKIVRGTITYGIAAAQDTDGHGTNVAGIAAAATNNAFGFAGVGFNSSLQIYKVFPDGANPVADTGDEAQAIYDAVAHGANVINISIAGSQDEGFDPVERDAVSYAIAHDVTIVAAAGNERSSGSSTIDFPAAYPGVISVGATSLNDSAQRNVAQGSMEYVTGYSNFGPELSLVAPGGDPTSITDPDLLHWVYNIYTTTPYDPTRACKNINDCKGLFAGTSQATPHVAGAAALMLAVNPSLTPAQIAQILESTADDIHDPFEGHGRLNVYRALAAVESDTTGLPWPTAYNFRAFAYTVAPGSKAPTILDLTYTNGYPVSSSGTFRIDDVPPTATNFKIGVWDDVNGDGIVDAGDYFGSSSTCLSATVSCAGATSITVHPVGSSFVLQ